MTITWKPVPGQGYWRNAKLIGEGDEIDEINCIIKKGTFNNDGKLNGADCTIIDYSDSSNVSVRTGPYNEGKENGTVYEYVFSKANWDDFCDTEQGVLSTRYAHTFINGVWSSTTETKSSKRIKANASRTAPLNNMTQFDYKELA